jgi:hypothetical protein
VPIIEPMTMAVASLMPSLRSRESCEVKSLVVATEVHS